MNGDNYSQIVLGMSGKGKSFIGKLQLTIRRLRNDLREAVILDPQMSGGMWFRIRWENN